jgi:hypothetical protein
MRVEDVEIYTGEPPVDYWDIQRVVAEVGTSLLTVGPTVEIANMKLSEYAIRLRGNAVIHVRYRRRPMVTSWKGMKATGVVVVLHEWPGQQDDGPGPGGKADIPEVGRSKISSKAERSPTKSTNRSEAQRDRILGDI